MQGAVVVSVLLDRDMCRFCALSLHREVSGVTQCTWLKSTMHSTEGCCTVQSLPWSLPNQSKYSLLLDR